MDIHQHHQRALCPRLTHGSLDVQRNDRLGRRRSHECFEHGREILRPIYSNADTHRYGNADSDGDSNSNSYTYNYSESYCYADRNAQRNAAAYAITEAASHSGTAPLTRHTVLSLIGARSVILIPDLRVSGSRQT